MPLAKDLLHPPMDDERRKHKKKRLVQSPNSYFMDVKCPGCYKITTGNEYQSVENVQKDFFLFRSFSFQSRTNRRSLRWL